MYLDSRLKVLTRGYFRSYKNWFAERLQGDSALKDILTYEDGKHREFFDPGFWQFACGLAGPRS